MTLQVNLKYGQKQYHVSAFLKTDKVTVYERICNPAESIGAEGRTLSLFTVILLC